MKGRLHLKCLPGARNESRARAAFDLLCYNPGNFCGTRTLRRQIMHRGRIAALGILFFFVAGVAYGQSPGDLLSNLKKPHDYNLKRISSYDRTGGNDDYRPLPPGETLSFLDEAGPGEISHVLISISSDEQFHLKKMVLRMYWYGEASPSVEAPVGD